MKHYLDLDFKTGELYEYSSVAKEGYDEYTSTKGNVSYRRTHKQGVAGTLRSAYISKGDFGALELRIMIDKGDNSFMIKLPVHNSSNGRLETFVEDLISTLPKMEVGQDYVIFPYVLETERINKTTKKPIMKRGISVKSAVIEEDGKINKGDSVGRGLRFLKKDEKWDQTDLTVIPPLDFKDTLGSYKPTAISLAAKKDFMEARLSAEVERLNVSNDYDANAAKSAPAAKAEQTVAPEVIPDEVPRAKGATAKKIAAPAINIIADDADDDDLPF